MRRCSSDLWHHIISGLSFRKDHPFKPNMLSRHDFPVLGPLELDFVLAMPKKINKKRPPPKLWEGNKWVTPKPKKILEREFSSDESDIADQVMNLVNQDS